MEDKIIINFENVNISHEGNPVLDNVNFKIKSGDFVYIIGRVGSGKTSLIRAINGEISVNEATTAQAVDFDLKTLKPKAVHLLRRKLGVVFQDFKLLTDRSVFENLAFVLRATDWKDKKKIAERINEVLDSVELRSKLHKMPHQLSGGEQQRVAIARALLNNPMLLLADEPTGNLDPETSDKIMEILFDLNSKLGITIIMATHNHTLLKKYPAQTYKCDKGNITKIDDTEEIDFEYFG
ncbi:MAG: ATP-binding cassette domain-containing protein [Prevotellaceae bacterium]|jgi:cell division transport system ATP-binding protein|nr:ATP-binding cassette domain-containing protein [Prevotellaceae bacterium]